MVFFFGISRLSRYAVFLIREAGRSVSFVLHNLIYDLREGAYVCPLNRPGFHSDTLCYLPRRYSQMLTR